MSVCEYLIKPKLRSYGIRVPKGETADTPEGAEKAAARLGPCVVKAQVPTGKRGKAGGILRADDPTQAFAAGRAILGMDIDGHRVKKVLVEEQVPVSIECYAAVLSDAPSQGPLLLFSTMGGMDVEEAMQQDPDAVRRIFVNILDGLDFTQASKAVAGLKLDGADDSVCKALVGLYSAYRDLDADLIEVNPLAISISGDVVALDCKLALDEASSERNPAAASLKSAEPLTAIEKEASAAGLKYIELNGSVGVLANGAGLTMTTMDAISHFGGKPANFLEIGGEAYTRATEALKIVLKNPNVRSLVVNFCGAFARTDVMTEGVIRGWLDLDPRIPVFFTIHGTGDREAVALVRTRLGIQPFELMDDAVRAAVAAAEGGAG